MASFITGDAGCGYAAAPAGDYRAIAVHTSYTPAVASYHSPGGKLVQPLGELAGATVFGLQKILFGPKREEVDARNAVFIAFEICEPPSGEVVPQGPDACLGRGVVGARAALLDVSGNRITEPWATPLFLGPSSQLPDVNLDHVGENSAGYFYDVPPGRYLLRLTAPDGKDMTCTSSANGLLGIGWPAQGANTFVAVAEEAMNNVVLRAFCDVH